MSLRTLSAFAILLASSTALAASDLTVSTTLPVGVSVYQSGLYSTVVRNIGNQTAQNTSLTIQLPVTHTSPNVEIMGTLGAFDARCVRSGTKLVCSLGAIARNLQTTVSFNLNMPYSQAPLVITSSVTTTSAESNLANNSASATVSLLVYSVPITPPRAATNQHCTGTNLTSFYECVISPSSTTSHNSVFDVNGVISFPTLPASYTGTWSQPTPDRLIFEYFNNGQSTATFDGRGTSASCFEGVTHFANSVYVSPYRVCLQ